MTVGGAVLAAGASRRAETAKALVCIDGAPLVVRAVRTLRTAGCAPVWVVVGPPHGARVEAAVDAPVLHNPTPERGMLSSLKLAIDAARAARLQALVVSLVDHPRVVPATVRALVEAWAADRPAVTRPRYAERRGHPYVLDGAAFDAVTDLPDGADPRPTLRGLPTQLDVEVADPAVLEDLDDAAALRRLS
jgi:CTP:molybdopterin cytidylyltransferase MocA